MLPEHTNTSNRIETNATNGHTLNKTPTTEPATDRSITPKTHIVHFALTHTNANYKEDDDDDDEDGEDDDYENNNSREQRKSCVACQLSKCISFQDNVAEVQHRKGRRLNGLQLPLHPLQVFGWFVLILFGVASFWVLIPSFVTELQGPLYGLVSGLYIVHIVSHLAALLIDPADRELRRLHRNDRIVPEFDRAKHSHVIENGRCHLCNIRTTSQRTKHCSVCNKCVGKFDHHCKWLNHCIGSRNYVAFLMCVVSAVVATLVIVAAAVAQIVLYHFNPEWLSFWYMETEVGVSKAVVQGPFNETTIEDVTVSSQNITLWNDTIIFANQSLENATVASINGTSATPSLVKEVVETGAINGIGFSDTIFLVFIGFLGVLAAITAGLLLHLCFFHIYISFLGLTTYEYIRNHRQQQQQQQQQTLSTLPKNGSFNSSNGSPGSDSPDPSKTSCSQVYFCSSLRHPNSFPEDFRLFQAKPDDRPTTLHCCENSREYHQTAMKTYYMCSMLEADVSTTASTAAATIAAGGDIEGLEKCKTKSFHCCSEFTQRRRKLSAAANKATMMGQIEASATTRSFLHFSEQCTFCTFRIKTPLKTENVKTLSKHHRWRRKWNCCSSVPDSPDVPNDIISTISMNVSGPPDVEHGNGAVIDKSNPTQIPVHFIKTNGANHKPPQRARLHRPWPIARFRHMMRMINRYRRPRCRHNETTANATQQSARHSTPTGISIKQNQIRPIPYPPMYDSSSSPSSDHSTVQSIETILPTSVIRDQESSYTSYNASNGLMMPSAPPPARRKMPNPTDLDELADTLGFARIPPCNQQRLPALNSAYRRQRRKHFLRTRSPTLSPIHESGLSNPTSPQPCRHGMGASCSPGMAKSLCSTELKASNGSLNSDSDSSSGAT